MITIQEVELGIGNVRHVKTLCKCAGVRLGKPSHLQLSLRKALYHGWNHNALEDNKELLHIYHLQKD